MRDNYGNRLGYIFHMREPHSLDFVLAYLLFIADSCALYFLFCFYSKKGVTVVSLLFTIDKNQNIRIYKKQNKNTNTNRK